MEQLAMYVLSKSFRISTLYYLKVAYINILWETHSCKLNRQTYHNNISLFMLHTDTGIMYVGGPLPLLRLVQEVHFEGDYIK